MIFLVMLTIGPGCGGQTGPKRVAAEGTVEVESISLMTGSITFIPAEGHRGPAANGMITDGQFRIPASEGPTVGPHLAVISLIPGKMVGKGSAGKPLRTKWEVKVEIDDRGLNHDFVLHEND